MKLEKILIIGAGNGGQAMAVDLTLKGFSVCLYEFPKFAEKLGSKISTRRISVEGIITGEIDIDLITTDKNEASKYSKTVLVTMPAYGHQKVFEEFKNLLPFGSNIFFFPGNLSCLTTPNALNFVKQGINLVECNSLPYGCRIGDDGTVKISIRTSQLSFSAFPSMNTQSIEEDISRIYPNTMKGIDILEVSLNNPNPLIHPPGVLLNLGRIENANGKFYMYNEGMTSSVLNLIKAMDNERMSIGNALGYELIKFEEFKGNIVDGTEQSFIDCGKFGNMLGPCNRENRYLTEDVPYGLVYWSEISKRIKVPTPVIDGIINITSAVLDTSFDIHRANLALLPGNQRKIRNLLYDGCLK